MDTSEADDKSGPESGAAPGRARWRAQRGGRGVRRGTQTYERDAPAGCAMRRFHPTEGHPYWLGELPSQKTDKDGHRSRQRSFHPGLRTEARAIELVENWLEEANGRR